MTEQQRQKIRQNKTDKRRRANTNPPPPSSGQSPNPLLFETSLSGLQHFILDHENIDEEVLSKYYWGIRGLINPGGHDYPNLVLAASVILAKYCNLHSADEGVMACAREYVGKPFNAMVEMNERQKQTEASPTEGPTK